MIEILRVLAISITAGAATGIGAVPIFAADRISHRIYDGMIALAAGVMLGASIFSLILPGLEIGVLPEVFIGILAGGLFLLVLNELVPHIHTHFKGGRLTEYKRKAILIGSSITIHNFPEGLTVGIALGSGLKGVGLATALAIGIQNIPDGFAFAVPAEKAGLNRPANVFWTTMSGALPESIAALLGFLLVSTFEGIFPLMASFAAGTMMAVVSREMIPESHGHDYSSFSTAMFLIGFVLMIAIDNVFAV